MSGARHAEMMQMPLGRSGGRGKNLLGQEVADFAVRSQSGRRSTWRMQTERSEKRGESRRGIGGNQKGQHSLTRQRGSELLNDPWASFIHATQYAGKSLGRGDLIRSSKTNRKFVVKVGTKDPLIPSQLWSGRSCTVYHKYAQSPGTTTCIEVIQSHCT